VSSRSRLVSLALALLAACDDPAAPATPRVRSIFILPFGNALPAGTSGQLQVQVDADAGADTTVRWKTLASPAGMITPSGFLRTCFPGGVLTIVAESVADPTKTDTVPVAVTAPTLGWAAVSDLSRPNPSTPRTPADFVDPGAMNGDVEVEVLVSGSVLVGRCRAVESVEIAIVGAAAQVTLARFYQATPFTTDRRFRTRFQTTAVPDGDYTLGGSAHLTGVDAPQPILPLRVTVRNR
jgi:hypothetical protein